MFSSLFGALPLNFARGCFAAQTESIEIALALVVLAPITLNIF